MGSGNVLPPTWSQASLPAPTSPSSVCGWMGSRTKGRPAGGWASDTKGLSLVTVPTLQASFLHQLSLSPESTTCSVF
jgi:hypothetical protein